MTKTNQHGFSLIELLVVIMVIMVMAAMAAPMMGPVLRRIEMESASRRVAALMVRARSEAMRLNRRVCTGLITVDGRPSFILDVVAPGDIDGDPCNNGATVYDTPATGPKDTFVHFPRTVLNGLIFPFSAGIWCTGMPPGYCGGALEATSPPGRIVFSPRGTMELWNGASYVTATQVQALYVFRFIPGSVEQEWMAITVTPYGQTKVFRLENNGRWSDL